MCYGVLQNVKKHLFNALFMHLQILPWQMKSIFIIFQISSYMNRFFQNIAHLRAFYGLFIQLTIFIFSNPLIYEGIFYLIFCVMKYVISVTHNILVFLGFSLIFM